jgi:hypothetical protein
MVTTAIAETAAPANRPRERLDATELPPPKPLAETLEALAGMDDDSVFVQVNDRVPKHLYPVLDERGWNYDTTRSEGSVVTAIWRGR